MQARSTFKKNQNKKTRYNKIIDVNEVDGLTLQKIAGSQRT